MPNIENTNSSYKLASGQWVPQVRERTYFSDRVEERELTWHDNKQSTKEEADAFVAAKIAEIQKARDESPHSA